jgi:hypothetical protein
MKPAFTTLRLVDDGAAVEVTGPIDLDGTETDAYFWVRIFQGKGEAEVDAVGIENKEEDALQEALATADERLLGVLADAAAAAAHPPDRADAPAPETPAQMIRSVTAMWDARIGLDQGTEFNQDEPAQVEAWALVRARNPTRVFHVYWSEQDVDWTKDAPPAAI